ncbi:MULTISPECIES: UDP-glucose 4-epimerase GalE [unclassified Corynebacterium]|uniref:UDP-glucose 4-epimerase GalE n=1 Tax=unclassified Corynebacterium TaxID=2624378 RepID=UPI0030A43911
MSDQKQGLTVFVTGGAGFIGSHVVVSLIEAGHTPVVFDDFTNSNPAVFDKIAELTGTTVEWIEGDITNAEQLTKALSTHEFDAVMHFAGRKAVGESCDEPELYMDVNIGGTATLLAAMRDTNVKKIIFSSSCSVYGIAESEPLTEKSATAPTNPYSWSKLTCEGMLENVANFRDGFAAVSLRYFNPIGAHPSGLIGEDGRADSPNIMPRLLEVATGERDKITVFGKDYDTRDGSCIRDYLHVVDIADAHVQALALLDEPGHDIINLGTGVGTTVFELINELSAASGNDVTYEVGDRRPGDVPALVADARYAEEVLGWVPKYDVSEMCRDAWRFYTEGRTAPTNG